MTADGKRPRALVTGASGGIGEAFARRLAQRGYDLVLVARRRPPMERLAAELAAGHGAAADIIEADLSRPEQLALVEERLRDDGIDLLVNNAGFGTCGEFAALPLERETEEVDLNVRALMRLTHAALGPMVRRGSGGIINVASTAAFQPLPHMATYAGTKAFVLYFSEAVHEEVKRYGVSVTALCPGPVRTNFQSTAGVDDERLPSIVWTDVDRVVEEALSSLRRRRAFVVPGVLNQVGAAASQYFPRFLVRRIAGSMFRRRARD